MHNNFLKRKDGIILTSIEIIDQLGVQGLTIREIASRQGISEAAIYRHFSNKTEILLATIDFFSFYDTLLSRTINSQNMTAREGIKFLIQSYSQYYENYPAISAVAFAQEAFLLEPEAWHKMVDVVDNRFQFINKLVIEGQNAGEINTNISSESLVDMIFGSMHFITLRWRAHNYGFPLTEHVLATVSSLLEAYSPPQKENRVVSTAQGNDDCLPAKTGPFFEKKEILNTR